MITQKAYTDGLKYEDLQSIAEHECQHARQHISIRTGGNNWRTVDDYWASLNGNLAFMYYTGLCEADSYLVGLIEPASWYFITINSHFNNGGNNIEYIYADIELIEKAINALIDNANFACQIEGSKINISGKREAGKSPFIKHDWLAITVRDNGPGIPQEYLSEIKKLLFTTWKEEGHPGLGLAIAEKIIQVHGGSLFLGSTLGEGTTATLYLPKYYDKI